MATRVKYTSFIIVFAVLKIFCCVPLAGNNVGIEIECGEIKLRITVKRQLLEERGVPFTPEHVRLGANTRQQRSCRAKGGMSESELVISAGLRECGTESSVRSALFR